MWLEPQKNIKPIAKRDAAAVAYNDRIYILGGYNGGYLSDTYEYVPNEDTWVVKANMPSGRYSLTVTSANGNIYAIGGWSSTAGYTNIVEMFDPSANVWTSRAPMPTARDRAASATVNNKIYVIGGSYWKNSTTYILNNVEEYDPVTNTWTTKAPMPTARCAAAATVMDGKIYVIGGNNGSNVVNTLEIYDPATNTWVTKTGMLTARCHGRASAVNGKIYAYCGSAGSGSVNTIEVYDPVADVWVAKQSFLTARYYFASVTINNKIYIMGGYEKTGTSNLVEEYDPVANTCITRGHMPTARYTLDAAVAQGKIYAIGGTNNSQDNVRLSSTEEYTLPTIIPESPINASATVSNSKVILSWNSDANATGYNVKKSTTPEGPYTTIANNISATSYTDTEAIPGITYYYVISAVGSGGESTDSTWVQATITTPTPMPTENTDTSPTPTLEPTDSPTNTPEPTFTPTPTPTETQAPTNSPSQTATNTPVPTNNYLSSIEVQSQNIVKKGNLLNVKIALKNATDIYAQDFTINYDVSCLEFSTYKTSDGTIAVSVDKTKPGKIKYTLISNGEVNALNGDKVLVNLSFKTKEIGKSRILITDALIADGDGNELIPGVYNKDIEVFVYDYDINGDGKYTIGDLAIISKNLGKLANQWTTPKVDVNRDGVVDIKDVNLVKDKMNGGI